MISSMTGYGRGEVSAHGITVVAEIRSVNNRFLELSVKLPRSLSHRENDIKEQVRKKISRGKINLTVTVDLSGGEEAPLKINHVAAKAYYKALKELRKSIGSKEPIKLEHLLTFEEVLRPEDDETENTEEWNSVVKAVEASVDALSLMRRNEGGELLRDIEKRLRQMESIVGTCERLSKERVVAERTRLRDRIAELVEDTSIIEDKRLEFEIALLADKLDITEECVRFRSHVKFFIQGLEGDEAAGRKLNFLLQEMNREVNTIGSKSYDAEIAHFVVEVKEDLEKIREQLQNIE
jgi:uncharacterized protein (TIGR00255 family)